MHTEIEQLKIRLDKDLSETINLDSRIERLGKTSQLIEGVVSDLKEILIKEKFESEREEINYFKTFKPGIVSIQISEIVKYNLDMNKPVGTFENVVKYYEEELKVLNSFFRLNNYHYQYYKNGLTQLDHLYFLRSAGPSPIPFVEMADNDAEYSTPMSYLFAKFIAYENVQYYIIEQISELNDPLSQKTEAFSNRPVSLRWTGDAVNIVELAYGIYLTGQLNNGNASLSQIVRWLEKDLNITIGNIQHRFSEIGNRKRLSPTKFIDQMKDTIIQRIQNNNQ